MTFPSTKGSTWLNAIEAMAPAVYGPIPENKLNRKENGMEEKNKGKYGYSYKDKDMKQEEEEERDESVGN